jgi:hypothetical protein
MALNSKIVADAKAEVIENLKGKLCVEEAFSSFERYFHESAYLMDATRYVGMVLIDGLCMKEEELMDQIGNRTNVYFIGGSAGDDYQFSETFVCTNGRPIAMLQPCFNQNERTGRIRNDKNTKF